MLLDRYRREVYEFARRRGLGREDAEDVAQEVLLGAWGSGALAPGHGGLVMCIARRVMASFLRRELAGKRDRRRLVSLDKEDFEEGAEVTEAREWERARRLLDRVARQAGDPKLRVLQLRLQGSSYREIAEWTGRRLHDVTNYLHRAKKGMRARVGGMDGPFAIP